MEDRQLPDPGADRDTAASRVRNLEATASSCRTCPNASDRKNDPHVEGA